MNQFLGKYWKLFGILLLLLILVYSIYIFFDILILITVSILLAMIFNPLVFILERHGFSRLVSVFIVFGISLILVLGSLSILIPKIAIQINALTTTLSQNKISKVLEQLQDKIKVLIPFLDSKAIADKLSNFFSSLVFSTINNFSNILSSIVSVIAISVIVPFMTFFILKDNKWLIRSIINIMPNKYFEMSFSVINKISIQLGRYVRGWILDAFLVGLLSGVGLTILGIKNSVTIGIVAGIGHLIPYFGPIVGGVPAILISIIQFGDLSMLPSIIVMFLLIYAFDNGFIQPNVFSKSTDFHPLIIIILIIAGEQLLGIFGMLIAVPTATVIRTAAKEIYSGFKNYKIIKT